MVRHLLKEVKGINGFVTRIVEELLARMEGEGSANNLFSYQFIMKLKEMLDLEQG